MSRVAAIDCGTNSLRLLIADVADGVVRDVVRRMEIVRLGEGVDRTGRFSAAALERTRVVLAEYAAEIRALDVERVRLAATSASRDAANRDDFRAMVVATLGVEPEVVTGDEEARLSFRGATADLPNLASPYLVVDIGGGSTEFVLGVSDVDAAVSVDIGCVRLTERHLHSDPPTESEVDGAIADIRAGIAQAATVVPIGRQQTLVGLAGSVTTVVALALGLPEYDAGRIHHARATAGQVAEVTAMLLGGTRAERAALPVMHPGRVDVIGAGALILREVLAAAGAAGVVASEHDILDGIALALA